MLLIAEIGEDGVGQAAVADLNRIPVLNDAGHILPDLLGDFIRGHHLVFQQGFIMADDEVHVFDVDKPIPVHPGHMVVDLGNDQGGLLHGCLHNIHTDSQAHISMRIRGRGLDQRHVDGHQPPVY